MDKQDIRYLIAFGLMCLGFLLILGTYGKYEFDGYISPAEFIGKIFAGLALMAAALPVSGDLDELLEQLSEKRKNR